MYFAVLQGGAESLQQTPVRRWTRRALIDAAGLPLALSLRSYRAVLGKLAPVRVDGQPPATPAILCVWHRDLFLVLPERGPNHDWLSLPPVQRVDTIARASEALGFNVLREAFGEDGTPPAALSELVRDGARALLSVDGPKEPGIIRRDAYRLAVDSGAPLVPLVVSSARGADLPGGMHVPLPGGEVRVTYKAPIAVGSRTAEEVTSELAEALRG